MSTQQDEPLTIRFEIHNVAQRRAIRAAARSLGFRVESGESAVCFAVSVASVEDVYRLGQMTVRGMKGGGDRRQDR